MPTLIAAPGYDRAARARTIASIKTTSSAQTLVMRLRTTDDPLVLWALHLKLDRLCVPPCQRWPARTDSDQDEFITLLADLLWLCRRLPGGHSAGYRGWRDLLAQVPNSRAWHDHAMRQYDFYSRRASLAHRVGEGLGLTDAQRLDTMMLPTAAMRAARQRLHPAALADMERELLSHAMAHPDRSGEHQPHAIASRRLRLWRCWVLAGASPGRAARHWEALTGEALTRQRVTAIVAEVDPPAGRRRCRSVN